MPFERAIAVVSLDAELIWGYMDLLDEEQFCRRYPGVRACYSRVLDLFCAAAVPATWFVVGGMALAGSQGPQDARMAGLPPAWARRAKPGSEVTQPLWYSPSFVRRLREATPAQEVGLHGGLTHLPWTHPEASPSVIQWELEQGLLALEAAGIRARSFSHPRTQEAHYDLLASHGLSCFRGSSRALSYQLGQTLPGAVLRMLAEIARTTPAPVFPYEVLPGLWNVPASLFLYPIGRLRSAIVWLRTRVARVRRGLEAAIRHKAVFHYCLHPATAAESPMGFALLEEILETLARARSRGDVEILTLEELTRRVAAPQVSSVPVS